MNSRSETLSQSLKTDTSTFMGYLKANLPVFHNSNLFYRDIENGVKGYFEKKGSPLKNKEAAGITMDFLEHLEKEKVLIKTSDLAWKVNYPEFVTTKPGDPF